MEAKLELQYSVFAAGVDLSASWRNIARPSDRRLDLVLGHVTRRPVTIILLFRATGR